MKSVKSREKVKKNMEVRKSIKITYALSENAGSPGVLLCCYGPFLTREDAGKTPQKCSAKIKIVENRGENWKLA